MSISVRCEECGKGYRLGDERAGTRIRCKSCGSAIEVPCDEFGDDFDEPPQPARHSTRSTGGRGKSAGTKKSKKKSGGVHPGVWIGGGAAAVAGVVVVCIFAFGKSEGEDKPQEPEGIQVVDNANDGAAELRKIGARVQLKQGASKPLDVELGRIDPPVDDALFREIVEKILQPLDGKVRFLSLQGTRVTDAGLEPLKKLRGLEVLDLSRMPITNMAIACVWHMNELRDVRLRATTISDAGVRGLARLPNLQAVALNNTRVTGNGIRYLLSFRPGISIDSNVDNVPPVRSVAGAGNGKPKAPDGLQWTQFTPDDKAFRVEFPGKPEILDRKARGGEPLKRFVVFAGPAAYEVSYLTNPNLRSQSREQQAVTLRTYVRRQVGGKFGKAIDFEGRPAVEFETASLGFRRYHRACVVGDRLYDWMVSVRQADTQTSPDRFLDSFAVEKSGMEK